MAGEPSPTLQFSAPALMIGDIVQPRSLLEVRHAGSPSPSRRPDVRRAAAGDIQAADRGRSPQGPRNPQSEPAGKLHPDRRELAATSQRPDRVHDAAPADHGLTDQVKSWLYRAG